jgi:hypothetical protein
MPKLFGELYLSGWHCSLLLSAPNRTFVSALLHFFYKENPEKRLLTGKPIPQQSVSLTREISVNRCVLNVV